MNERSRALERRLAVPVLVAALLSVPALFLMIWGSGGVARAGYVVNWVSGLVLWVEWILLIALADNKRAWIRDHKWTLAVAAATVPAVVLVLGPVQVLRALLALYALRVARVTRIVEAGGVLGRRMGLTGWARMALFAVVGLLSVVFVAMALAAPDSETRRLLAEAVERWGAAPVVGVAALLLTVAVAATGWYVRRRRQRRQESA